MAHKPRAQIRPNTAKLGHGMTATQPPMTGPMRSTKALPASNLGQRGRQRRPVNIVVEQPTDDATR
jgi:hypothetical protein